jgi:hypothetical protein
MTSITRNTTFGGGPPGTRTPNLRIKSPLLCQIELEARRSLSTRPLASYTAWTLASSRGHVDAVEITARARDVEGMDEPDRRSVAFGRPVGAQLTSLSAFLGQRLAIRGP